MFDTHINLMPIVMVCITAFGIPLATFFARLAIAEVTALAKPYIGEKTALLVQQRANELFDKGIGAAALKYLPLLQARGLTVDVGNLVAKEVADYFVGHAPDLALQIGTFEGSLEEKAKARLIAHPAIQAALTPANDNAPLDVRTEAQKAA